MKRKKIILGFSCLIIVAICTFNVQTSFIMAKKAGYSRLIDIITLTTANASVNPGGSCGGSTCDQANGNKYNTCTIGTDVTCCGLASSTSGKKN